MNLPSSLALPQSKLFQSRIFLVLLLVLAVLIGAGVFYFMRPLTPPKAPTVATSPAAQAIPRPTPAAPVAPVPAFHQWTGNRLTPDSSGARFFPIASPRRPALRK